MSATLEGERLSRLLDDAPVVAAKGACIRWISAGGGRSSQASSSSRGWWTACCRRWLTRPAACWCSCLGRPRSAGCTKAFRRPWASAPEILLCPLHGELDLNAQRAAIDPPAKGLRKVVLATNIAETSLTIDGVRVVIDAGLARVPRFDPGSGMTRLDTQRISRASATQRAGRAGRLEPGVCYRLWSEAQHDQLAAHGSAEILQADLAGLALQLARWGVPPSSCAGSTSRRLPRSPRPRTCWRGSAPSGRAAATP
jgi:ATP-dependent helicase HrpB